MKVEVTLRYVGRGTHYINSRAASYANTHVVNIVELDKDVHVWRMGSRYVVASNYEPISNRKFRKMAIMACWPMIGSEE